MRILIISDLHLGDGSPADDFGNRDKKLIDWIDDHNADRVYLNGDIYELWQFKSQAIRNAHYLLVKYLTSSCIHIRGNHDYQLMGPLSKTIKASGRSIHITHGFQNDKWMTNPFARLGIWALTWLERKFPGIDNENTYKRKNRNEKKEVPSRTQQKTKEYAEKMLRKHDIVVCGHTHTQMITPIKGKPYANSGTCQGESFQGIVIDTLTGDIKKV